jgi:phosphoribosylanthranilate isomerase
MEWVRALPPIPCKVAVFGKVNRVAFKGIYDLIQGSEWDEYPEPAAKRILALRIKASQSPQDFRDITVNAAAILLDAHTEGQYGGTGQTIDWDFAAEFVQRSESPVILAGGLNPDNVAEAVQRVRPFMVDVSTGVEATLRNKDKAKIIDFIQAAKNA